MCHAEQALAERNNGNERAGILSRVLNCSHKGGLRTCSLPWASWWGWSPWRNVVQGNKRTRLGRLHLNVYPESVFAVNVLDCCGLCVGCKEKSGLIRAPPVQSIMFHASHTSSDDLSPMFRHSAT